MKHQFSLLRAAVGAVPVVLCLGMRTAEGSRVWHESAQVLPGDAISLIATALFMFAVIVQAFDLDPAARLAWNTLVEVTCVAMNVIVSHRVAVVRFARDGDGYWTTFAIALAILIVIQIAIALLTSRRMALEGQIKQRIRRSRK